MLYFGDMLEGLFIRKANFDRISSILKKENFSYTREDVESLLKGNQKGTRYGNAVLMRDEAGGQRKRFIKIILDGKWRTYQPFRRQVQITSALHEDKNFTHPTMSVLRSSLTPLVPYAIFETREDGEGFGFMHDSPAFYDGFTEDEMRRLVEVLYSFHLAGFNIKAETLNLTRPISSLLSGYKKEFKEIFDTRITHKTEGGVETVQKVEQLLISYTGMPDIQARVMETLEKNFSEVEFSKTKKGSYLVHADMQIDNVYKHKNGDFELLDFEWVGRSDSPAIAIMFDYGNLRARAWSSPSFQELLDRAMFEVGTRVYPGQEEMIRAALVLGTLRSSLGMSRFHLDFINTVKKDRRTEEEYYDMYPKTIEVLRRVLA